MITKEQFKYADLFTKDAIDKQIIIDYGNGQLTNKNLVMGQMELTESICSEEQLVFGSCEASMLKFRVLNAIEPLKEKTLVVTETLDHNTDAVFNLGTYYVNSDVPTADRKYRDIVAYDAMYRIINLNVADWYNSLTFPMTLKAFRDSFFAYLGIMQKEVELINDDMVIQKTIANKETVMEEDEEGSHQKEVITDIDMISGKEIITAICEINGVFGHINRNNMMTYIILPEDIISTEYRWGYPSDDLYPGDDLFPFDSTSVYLGSNMYTNPVQYEDWTVHKIDKLQIRQEENDIGVTSGTGDNAYVLEGNFLLYGKGTEELQPIADKLLSIIGNVVPYQPTEINAKGNPCVEVGDGIAVFTNDGVIKTLCLQRVLKGNQSLKDTYTATGKQMYEEQINSVSKELIQLRSKANILERTIEKTQSSIVDIEGGLKTTITQTAESIKSEAKKTYETKNDAKEEYSQLSSSIDQTAEGIKIDVAKTYQTKNDMSNYYTQTQTQGVIETSENNVKEYVSETYQLKDDMDNYITNEKLDAVIETTSTSITSTVARTSEKYDESKLDYKVDLYNYGSPNPILYKPDEHPNQTYLDLVSGQVYKSNGTEWSPYGDKLPKRIDEVETLAEQTDSKFSWIVKSGDSESNFELTDRTASLVADYINLKGLVKFTGLDKEVTKDISTGEKVYYLVSNSNTGVTISTPGWKDYPLGTSNDNRYLWQYYHYTFADGSTADSTPIIVGVYGDKGDQGIQGIQGIQGVQGEPGKDGSNGVSVIEVYPLYYQSNSTYYPSKPTSEVTSFSTDANVWTKAQPTFKAGYEYFYTCNQVRFSNGTFGWSDIAIDRSLSNMGRWCAANDTTLIDGGKIYTGSISADKIKVNDLFVGKIRVNDNDAYISGLKLYDNFMVMNGDTQDIGSGITGSVDYDNIAFWAGSHDGSNGFVWKGLNSPFYVTHDGFLHASNAEISGYTTTIEFKAQTAKIETLEAGSITIAKAVSAAEAKINIIEANYITAQTVSATYATINSLNAVDGKFANLNADNIKSGTLSADRISTDLLRTNNLATSIAQLKNVTMAAATVQSHLDIGNVGLDASTLKWVTIAGHEVLARS